MNQYVPNTNWKHHHYTILISCIIIWTFVIVFHCIYYISVFLLQYHFNWTSSPITGVHKFFKIRSHLKIVGATIVTSCEVPYEDTQILGATIHNLVTQMTWHLWSVHSCLNDWLKYNILRILRPEIGSVPRLRWRTDKRTYSVGPVIWSWSYTLLPWYLPYIKIPVLSSNCEAKHMWAIIFCSLSYRSNYFDHSVLSISFTTYFLCWKYEICIMFCVFSRFQENELRAKVLEEEKQIISQNSKQLLSSLNVSFINTCCFDNT